MLFRASKLSTLIQGEDCTTPTTMPLTLSTKDTAYYGGNSTDFFLKTVNNRTLQVPIDGPSNLPILLVKPNKTKCDSCDPPSRTTSQPCTSCSHSHSTSLSVFDETNQNLMHAQCELLLFHHRLAHLSFKHVQYLMRPASKHVAS